jgi:hypothetical protein
MVEKRPGRNEPCPCGSGKKYKSCCRGRKRDPFGARTGAGHGKSGPSKVERDFQDTIQNLKDHIDYINAFKTRPTEDIIRTLRGFGLVFDEALFREQTEGRISCYDVAKEHYMDQGHTAEGWDEDLIPTGIEELWKRLIPDRYNIEMVVDAVEDGYNHLEDGRDKEGLASWERAWAIVKALRPTDRTSVADLEAYFKDIVAPSLGHWLIDFETELSNTGMDDRSFLKRRLSLIREVLELLPESDPSFKAAMLRSEAETHSILGNVFEAERLFKAAVDRFPGEVVLYLGWGDMYGYGRSDERTIPINPDRAKAIYERGIQAVPEDRDLLEDRLEMLRERQDMKGSEAKDFPKWFYVPFYELFPDVAEKETRMVDILPGHRELPEGEYYLIELFCGNPDCDCRRVFLLCLHKKMKGPVAVIAYGWEDKDFYRKWLGQDDPDMLKDLKGPSLNRGSPQSELAQPLLKLVSDVLTDMKYIERIKRHYKMFKGALRKGRGKGRDGKPSKGVMERDRSRKVQQWSPFPLDEGSWRLGMGG